MQPQRLIVPLFQRRYVWNQESQWEPLCNDVARVADRVLKQALQKPQPHFLGAVVVQQVQNPTGLMLQFALFDDRPRVREIMYNYMRLRALRVEVDVKLALGEFTIEQAADHLQSVTGIDRATAWQEATFFASAPGQAITSQIGKLQIVKFLANAKRIQQDKFNLRAFHDFVWRTVTFPSPFNAGSISD